MEQIITFFNGIDITTIFLFSFTIPIIIIFFRTSVMKFNPTLLFINDVTGKPSHTKFWSNIAYMTATVVFIYLNIKMTSSIEALAIIWFIYLSIVASSSVASKWLTLKYTQKVTNRKQKQILQETTNE